MPSLNSIKIRETLIGSFGSMPSVLLFFIFIIVFFIHCLFSYAVHWMVTLACLGTIEIMDFFGNKKLLFLRLNCFKMMQIW